MTDAPITAADESRHPIGDGQWWNESWYFDFVAADGSIGGYVRIGLNPNQKTCWYWAAVVGQDRPTVMVRDHEVPLPKPPGLMIRNEGLWADHTIEKPLDRWSLGLEAFGVAYDDPTDALGEEWGERTPVGLEMEWDSVAPPLRYPGLDRYEVPCTIEGEVLIGDETIEVQGFGERDHSWGARDWWSVPWWWTTFHVGGQAIHGMTLDHPDLDYSTGFLAADGDRQPVTQVSVEDRLRDDGLLEGSTIAVEGRTWSVEAIGHAPVKMADPHSDRLAHLHRTMCRYTSDGDVGYGWHEHQRIKQA